MKHILFALVTITTMLYNAPSAMAEDARAIIDKVAAQPVPDSSAVKMRMEIRQKKRGTEEIESRTVKVLAKQTPEGARSLMKFVEPADIKDVGLLVRENKNAADDQFLYMPALKTPRRVSAAKRSENFMGTDFTFADLERPDADAATHKLLGEEMIDGKATWKIESTPKPDAKSAYSKSIQWIRKDIYIPVQADFYDKRGKHLKRLTVENLEQIDGFWIARKTTMENVQKQHSTILEIQEQKNNVEIDDKYFTERYLSK